MVASVNWYCTLISPSAAFTQCQSENNRALVLASAGPVRSFDCSFDAVTHTREKTDATSHGGNQSGYS
jgi:hypothetical protein